MKTCFSHSKIIAATFMTASFALSAHADTNSYRTISQDFGQVSEICDIDCKSTLSNSSHSAQDWLNTAVTLIKKEDFPAANYALRQILKIAKQERDMVLVPRALIELGGISYKQKNYSLAEGYFNRAVERAEHNNDCVLGATAYLNLGLVQRHMGNKTEARKMFRNSLRLTRGTKAHGLRTNAMFQYGRVLKELNNKAWAKKALRKARNLSQKYALHTLYKASQRELGAITDTKISSFSKPRIRTAITINKKVAKAIPRKLTKKELPVVQSSWVMRDQDMATTYDKLGMTHMKRRQYDMASDMFKKSIFLNKQMGNTVAQATAYKNLAKIYVKLGDHKNTCVNFWQARELMTKAKHSVKALSKQLKSNNCLYQQAALDVE